MQPMQFRSQSFAVSNFIEFPRVYSIASHKFQRNRLTSAVTHIRADKPDYSDAENVTSSAGESLRTKISWD
ncbi:hypothetical protein Q1695_003761 [Nippostrongylus brasiliensis]|nr:hypothetical protein Q1695_003761 [Nippostrongylus brasiliensis]